MSDLTRLHLQMARFASTPLAVDLAGLSPGDRTALVKLIKASHHIDDLFMKQLWQGNQNLWTRLQKDPSPLGKARARYYWMNKGPWSQLDDWSAFVPAVPARKPAGASFYPQDMTRDELEAWLEGLPPDLQNQAKGFFTVIQRGPEGKLSIVPYSQAYAAELSAVARLLREAAAATENLTLQRYLATRADALLSNDYYASDVAWMELDAPLEVTLGPYETYCDELFGYKAAFESYVTLRDDAETAKLSAWSRCLQEIENNLPIPDELKNRKIGSQAPIRVVSEVLAAGDAAHGVKSAAFNLPNDERVITRLGSKRVMLKNVQEAKFHSILVPISKGVLAGPEQAHLSFDSFFTHILAHELMHGLGPHQITVGGRATTVREELRDLYSATEEAKADVLGLFALQFLMDHAPRLHLEGQVPVDARAEERLYVTFLASSFRTMRFGLTEAHGQGMALQVNTLLDQRAIVVNAEGTFSIDRQGFRRAVRELARELLMIEARGDRAAAQRLFAERGQARPEIIRALAKLEAIPTDIDPEFVTAHGLVPRSTPS